MKRVNPTHLLGIAATALCCLLLASCAGMRIYSLGIPSYRASNFFISLESAAKAQGQSAYRGPDGVSVLTAKGDKLIYSVNGDAVSLTVLPNTDGLSKEQLAVRQSELRALNERLVAAARRLARGNKDFD